MSNSSTEQPKSWRDVLPIHPAAELFPRMSESELRELGEDIKKRSGLTSPVVLYRGKLLDGRNRLDAMELVGIRLDWSGDYLDRLAGIIVVLDKTTNPYDYVVAANVHRRHLAGDQKRELIAKVLKVRPAASNRQIAKQVKADDKTVASVRRDLESTAEIPQLKATVGKDGKTRKATRPVKAIAKPAARSSPAASPAPPAEHRRITAIDVIEVWMQMPPEEDRRVFEAIGLRRILASLPDAWKDDLEKWIVDRRPPSPPISVEHEIPDDLSVPEFLRRVPG